MSKQKDPVGKKLISGGVTVVLIVAICLCLFAFVQVINKGYVSVFGYSLFKVTTGSMEPTIPVGALLVTKNEPIDTVEINEIVSFFSKEAYMKGRIITHRVVASEESATGQVMLTTRGDANTSTDIHRVDESNYIGKVIWSSDKENLLAKLISFLSQGMGFFTCIAIPAVLISVSIFKNCISEITSDIKRLEEESKARQDKETSESKRDSASLQNNAAIEITSEEYDAICARIRAELTEELKTEDDWEQSK